MLLAAEVVRHFVIRRIVVRHVAAVLHVLRAHDVVAAAARTTRHVGADDGAAHRAANRRNVTPAAGADLMTENAADQRTGDGTADLRALVVVVALALDDLLAIDPALLSGLPHHGAHGRHVRRVDVFAGTTMPAVIACAGLAVVVATGVGVLIAVRLTRDVV